MSAFAYQGTELELFARASNWKRYWREQIAAIVRGDVLEVGAGIGTNTRLLETVRFRRWVCLEPDGQLARRIEAVRDGRREVVTGTLAALEHGRMFDTILYLDVLEHIRNDRVELGRAASRLRPHGRLVVLAPAHPWLASPVDRAIGHLRRYTRASLLAAAPPGLLLERIAYLDAAGLLASAANRVLLRSAMPTAAQVRFWDGVLVPLSRRLDRAFGGRLGKSLLAVWSRVG